MKFDSAARTIMAAVMVAATLGLSACTASAAAVDDRAPGELRVAFYGDSYTYGTGASAEEKRWSTVLSEQHGWSEFNPSVSGLGFMRNRTAFGEGDLPSFIISDNPDVVIVTMGLNDNFTFGTYADELPGQILSDFDRLATALPDAQLIVVEPFWYKAERPASVDVIISWVRDAAAEVGADYLPGASYWLAGDPGWIASDNLHPNDAGHAAIASQMDQALRKLGL
ncbi:SGNH/GDSL hydrolase family protein [Rhodoglobus aureus]|uniref:SGNH/GDSL hydrolase family protein n=1 Tax=Rhodoglobus aureus TaxID=191497 RepID=A0ABN1W097_9MICO